MIKSLAEVELMAGAGQLLASVFSYLDGLDLVGRTTMEINDLVEDMIVGQLGARPASKGQYGYGFVLNCSRNEVVCHGVPSTEEVVRDGDIVNFDITLEKNGYIADSSKTYLVGNVAPAARRLVRTTYEAMWKGILAVRPGAHLGDIGHAIERHAKRAGYSVVREYCGHGIGREMHEDPQILHFGKPGTGQMLREGMVFTVEPMLNQGRRAIRTLDDGWTVVTADGKLSAQFEHTVAVTGMAFASSPCGRTRLFRTCRWRARQVTRVGSARPNLVIRFDGLFHLQNLQHARAPIGIRPTDRLPYR